MWRNEDLVRRARRRRVPARRADAAADTPAEVGAIAKAIVDAGATACTCPRRRSMHGTGAFTSFQAMLARRVASSRSSAGTSTRTSCGRRCSASGSRRWRSSATRSRSRCCARSRRPRPTGTPYDISSLQTDHQLGRDVVGRGEAGPHGSAATSSASTRSVRAKASASPARSPRPGAEAQDREVHDRRRARRCSPTTATRSCPAPARSGVLAVGGNIPVGYYKDEAKSRATFRDDQRRSAGRCPATSRASRPTARSCCSAAARSCINSGGEKIFPEEVEEAVKLHPAVADCLVVGVPDERFGEAVTAVVSLATGRATRRPTSSAAALEALARFKRPRHFVFVARGRARPERQGRLQVGQGAAGRRTRPRHRTA